MPTTAGCSSLAMAEILIMDGNVFSCIHLETEASAKSLVLTTPRTRRSIGLDGFSIYKWPPGAAAQPYVYQNSISERPGLIWKDFRGRLYSHLKL